METNRMEEETFYFEKFAFIISHQKEKSRKNKKRYAK
jgi:hypothetical protein